EVEGSLEPWGLSRLSHGLTFEGRELPPGKVSWQNETRLRFALKGPRPGQLRDMCTQVGLEVVSIRRLRIGRIPLAKMPPGAWRYLPVGEKFYNRGQSPISRAAKTGVRVRFPAGNRTLAPVFTPPACPARLPIRRMRSAALSGYSLLATANALAQPTRPYRQTRDQAEHHPNQQAGAGADQGGFER